MPGKVGIAVVEGDLRAEGPASVKVGSAGRGDDPGTGMNCEKRCGPTHMSGGTGYEDRHFG